MLATVSTSSDHAAQPWAAQFASRAGGMVASEIRELLKILARPDVISFAGGIPDPALFPADQLRQACAELFADPARRAAGLQYSLSEGDPALRAWIVSHMAEQGVTCTPENVLITTGAQQALDFIGKLMLSPGDTVIASAPTYLGALQAFSAYEPHYERLRLDGGNATPAHYLDSARAHGGRPKLLYVVPDFANPSGETLDLAQRRRLLELADATCTLVVEDAAYRQLRYAGEPVPSVTALACQQGGGIEGACSVYCGTFSKTLAPGLRVGWIVGPRAVIEKLVLIKQAADLHSGTLDQAVIGAVARACLADRLPVLRDAYRRRRDAMLAALASSAPAGTRWSRPDGGLFVWVELPDGLDARALLPRAIEEAKVAYVPGSAFFFDEGGANTLRLSFSLADEATIDRGVRSLMGLVTEMAGRRPG
ncbi:aminotransferase-like domain-containing protein [Geminicoccus flavidas]|uniref:aminotransferase-like domain-containing protein n=1 Tax=Geminicoccus flavidas TaxID=2506407 RepID=UPI00135A3036